MAVRKPHDELLQAIETLADAVLQADLDQARRYGPALLLYTTAMAIQDALARGQVEL